MPGNNSWTVKGVFEDMFMMFQGAISDPEVMKDIALTDRLLQAVESCGFTNVAFNKGLVEELQKSQRGELTEDDDGLTTPELDRGRALSGCKLACLRSYLTSVIFNLCGKHVEGLSSHRTTIEAFGWIRVLLDHPELSHYYVMAGDKKPNFFYKAGDKIRNWQDAELDSFQKLHRGFMNGSLNASAHATILHSILSTTLVDHEKEPRVVNKSTFIDIGHPYMHRYLAMYNQRFFLLLDTLAPMLQGFNLNIWKTLAASIRKDVKARMKLLRRDVPLSEKVAAI